MPGCPRLAGLTNGTLWPSVTVWTRLAWLTTCARFSLDSRRQWQLGVLISYYDGKGSRSYGVSACIILNPLNDPAMYTMPCHQPDVTMLVYMYVPVGQEVQRVLHHLAVQSDHRPHHFQPDLLAQVGPVGEGQHNQLWIIRGSKRGNRATAELTGRPPSPGSPGGPLSPVFPFSPRRPGVPGTPSLPGGPYKRVDKRNKHIVIQS